MIPRNLKLSGFISYRNPVELDFSGFSLACISGPNGAGKSSILDAITYALYGIARKNNNQLINSASDKAEVVFDFEYEKQTYRIVRSIDKNGSKVEFYIHNPVATDPRQSWKTLSENDIRGTNQKIRDTLRMDYETFVNASFFLQGKADSFATQAPTKRKQILANILGLEQWDAFLDEAKTRRKNIEIQLATIDARLSEIQTELDQEEQRKTRFAMLEDKLKLAVAESKILQTQVETQRAEQEKLNQKRQFVDLLKSNFENAQAKKESTLKRSEEGKTQLKAYNAVLAKADETEANYENWQKTRKALEDFDLLYEQFKPMDVKRQNLLTQLELKRQSLQQDYQHLVAEQERLNESLEQSKALQNQVNTITPKISKLEEELLSTETLQEEIIELDSQKRALESENKNLLEEMNKLKKRQDTIRETKDPQCPFCEQALSAEHRQNLVDKIQSEGKELADRYRDNQKKIKQLGNNLETKNALSRNRGSQQNELQNLIRDRDKLSQQMTQIDNQRQNFENERAPKMRSIQTELENESFLPESRAEIETINEKLSALGYDAEAHRALRQAEIQQREAENAFHNLVKARSSVEQIKIRVSELEKELELDSSELAKQEKAFLDAAAQLATEEAGMPDISRLKRDYAAKKEEEDRLQREFGGAKQLLLNLDTQRIRRQELIENKETFNLKLAQYKSLERAFGKDGVPAMLIEQALPELEAQANDILLKLSDNTMSVSFNTQRELKTRAHLKETLDIVISDGSSTRDYETFSGGEAFRVNFAIRLALSRVLSQRAGAKLQTLVIDEGFGNQDARGRQLLIEAISMIENDFEKILVITHIDELKDQFPTRIEVEKDATGSSKFEIVSSY